MPFATDQSIVDSIVTDINDQLSKIGIIFRIFGRVKTRQSLERKLKEKSDEYHKNNKKMQDVFGIRVALYFSDDVDIAQRVVASLFKVHSRSVDAPTNEIFGPIRCNVIYHLPTNLADYSHLINSVDLIDSTFEVQYRTILSEGWHEVEHDLRYKCKPDWNDHDDLSRSLNGIIATLETCDWSMIKMFDELSWRHYKSGTWDPMIRTKFRLRFQCVGIPEEMATALKSIDGLAKAIFRVERTIFLKKLARQEIALPITPSNVVFIINRLFINNDVLKKLENEALCELLDKHLLL
jgi:ppGpp synthetase/RelA/SpoT-type nucleotidyltranferase